MLNEENQFSVSYQYEPVHKAAYDTVAEREIAEGAKVELRFENVGYGTIYKAGKEAYAAIVVQNEMFRGSRYSQIYDLTQEKATEIKARFERTVDLPIRTKVILDIICGEASAYFNEIAYSSEVCANIQSRVQKYLDEIN